MFQQHQAPAVLPAPCSVGAESQSPASPERSCCEDTGLLLDLWAAAARTRCPALTQLAQSVPWHTVRLFCSQMKPNVSYTSQLYLELTPAAGQDHKPNTCAVFSQQGISSGCRICQTGLSVANTLFFPLVLLIIPSMFSPPEQDCSISGSYGMGNVISRECFQTESQGK